MATKEMLEIQKKNAKRAKEKLELEQHEQTLEKLDEVKANNALFIQAFIGFLGTHKLKTEVQNFPDKVSNPESKLIAESVAKLATAIDNKKLDMSPMTALLEKMAQEVDKVPKTHPAPLKLPETFKINNFSELKQEFADIAAAIAAQKLEVKAPDVKVAAPKLDPLLNLLKAFIEKMDEPKEEKEHFAFEDSEGEGVRPKLTEDGSMNVVITEKYDSWKFLYDTWEEDEPQLVGAEYFLNGVLVAKVIVDYKGRLATGGRKVDVTSS